MADPLEHRYDAAGVCGLCDRCADAACCEPVACDGRVWVVSEETWEWLQARLAEPPQELPVLKKLLSRKPPWGIDRVAD